MDITKNAESIIRNGWNPHVPNRNRHQIANDLMTELKYSNASFMTGVRMGIVLGESTTPEEAIERLRQLN